MVAKSVEVDISVSGDVESKAKLEAIDKRAADLRASFGPAYEVKINAAAATQRLAVFRADFKTVADAVTKAQDVQIVTAKAQKQLDDIRVKADRLRATFPTFTARIDTAEAERKLAVLALDAKATTDKINREIAGAGTGGILSKIPGFGGGSGAAGGAAGAASGAGGVIPAGIPLIGGLGSTGGIAAVVAGLAALPFAAQAAAGGIVFAFGGAMTAIGVYAASKSTEVKAQFASLKAEAIKDFGGIGTPFNAAVTSILKTAQTTLPQILKPFGDALKSIAGPFGQFGDALVKSFGSPAVVTSMRAVGTAFGALLKAITPSIAGDMNNIASGITKVANAVAKNPDALRNFISFLSATVGGALTAIAALTRFASYIEAHFIPVFDGARHEISHVWADIASNTNDVWKRIWADTIGKAIQGGHAIEAAFNTLKGGAVLAVNTLKSSLATTWNTIWANTITKVTTGISTVVGFFKGLPGKITGALGNLLTLLVTGGGNIITGLFNGIKSVWDSVVGWFKGLPAKILSALGIASPPAWAIDAGSHIMNGILKGIAHGAADVKGFFLGIAKDVTGPFRAVWSGLAAAGKDIWHALFGGGGGAGAGAQQWSGLVAQALKMEGLSPGLLNNVLVQIQSESGGNPNAINLTDINAQRGDPSRGLLQTIMSTFLTYHWPGTSMNIYDPLANIAAALNYARVMYGPTLMNAGQGIGSGHGYAAGTLSAMPGWAMVGEYGPELLRFRGGEQVIPNRGGGSGEDGLIAEVRALRAELRAQMQQLTGVAAGIPRATGQHVGAAIGGAAHDASFRSRYH